jgi:hypothetical protein
MDELLQWLLNCDEPWTRYRVRVDLLGETEENPQVQAERASLLAHPQVHALLAGAAALPDYGALTNHNDARHPLHQLTTLADFGLRRDDPWMQPILQGVLAHQSPEGAFQILLNISPTFGGTGLDTWTWAACDAPTLLYALLAFGLGDDDRVQRAAAHLASLAEESGGGWGCRCAPELGKFRGPGRKGDPCPIANLLALKALSLLPQYADSPAVHAGAEMLLTHWAGHGDRKYYMFGVGSDYRKLKYPYVWYNLLHAVEVLSRYPFARADARLREMVECISSQADDQGRLTAGSMYQSWKGWSFADKKQPSPWLTFLGVRSVQRCA